MRTQSSFIAVVVGRALGVSALIATLLAVGCGAGNGSSGSSSSAQPVLSITKTHQGSFTLAQLNATYTVTVSNTGAGPTNGTAVTLTETVPGGLTLVSMAGTGWNCTASPTCTRSDVLAASASYPPITVTVNVSATAASPQVNQVSVSGGGSVSANATDSTTILLPRLSISKSHTGNFSQAQANATYTVTASNTGAGPTNGTAVVLTETVPAGLTLVSMAGTGWNCTVTPTCTRTDVLASGSSYPAITVTVNVAANAISPQINQVSVSGGGSLVANANDSTTILVPALSITKQHTGNFTQGQLNVTYTLTVSNAANAGPTHGTVTVTETAPGGLTLVSMAGTGWNCTVSPTCTRIDALAASSSYPTITVTANVAVNAVSPQNNQVSVSGGGSVTATSSDSTTILVPILSITKSHSGNFLQGQAGATYTVTVSNTGTGPTNGTTVTVTETVPTGLTLDSMGGTGWSCTVLPTCTCSDALANGSSYPPITVTVDVASNASTPQINHVAVSSGGSVSASFDDSTTIVEPVLSITKSHSGNFAQGQTNAAYSVVVSNTGTAATAGTVTVTELIPAGLSLVSMAGTGWTCPGTSGMNTCDRSDTLANGLSYPAITVMVNVGASASSPQLNQVSVSGGGAATANGSDSTVITLSSCAGTPTRNESLLNGHYAFILQGFQGSGNGTPVAMVGSFVADGTGKLTNLGGGMSGTEDINQVAGPQNVIIYSTDFTTNSSFYTVGPDNRGCLQLVTGAALTTTTFRFSLGGISGGVASKARIIRFDDTTGTGTRASGVMGLQTTADFTVSHLQPRYAFGMDGADFTAGHFNVVGSFSVSNTTGNISSGFADTDDAGSLSTAGGLTGGTGTIGAISASTGRAVSSFSVGSGGTGYAANWATYTVNANEFFIISTDTFSATNPITSGRAIVTASSFSGATLTGNIIIHDSGSQVSGGISQAGVDLNLLTLAQTGANTDSISGTLFSYTQGVSTQTQTSTPGTATIDPTSGRATLTNIRNNPPVMYLATPQPNTEPIAAFLGETDTDAAFGTADVQPSGTYDTSSLAGTYISGTEDPSDNTVAHQEGVPAISPAGVVSGTNDNSGQGGLTLGNTITATVAITNSGGPGIGNAGPNTVAITNISSTSTSGRFFFIDESGGPAAITVVEK